MIDFNSVLASSSFVTLSYLQNNYYTKSSVDSKVKNSLSFDNPTNIEFVTRRYGYMGGQNDYFEVTMPNNVTLYKVLFLFASLENYKHLCAFVNFRTETASTNPDNALTELNCGKGIAGLHSTLSATNSTARFYTYASSKFGVICNFNATSINSYNCYVFGLR